MPLTAGELVTGMEVVGGAEDTGGVEDTGGADVSGTTEEPGTALDPGTEDCGTEESADEEDVTSVSTLPAVHSRIMSPTKSKNSTPTVTISNIARLSLR